MNCQKGDLAIIVRSDAGNEGLIVQCLELYPTFEFIMPDGSSRFTPTWRVDRELATWGGGSRHCWAADDYLKPIRPDGITTEEVKELFSPSPAKESEKV